MTQVGVKHDYHLVDPSPWPLIGSVAAFTMLIGAIFWMNKDYTGFFGLAVNGQPWIFAAGALLLLITFFGWWRDVIRESVVQGRPQAGGQAGHYALACCCSSPRK